MLTSGCSARQRSKLSIIADILAFVSVTPFPEYIEIAPSLRLVLWLRIRDANTVKVCDVGYSRYAYCREQFCGSFQGCFGRQYPLGTFKIPYIRVYLYFAHFLHSYWIKVIYLVMMYIIQKFIFKTKGKEGKYMTDDSRISELAKLANQL